MDGRIGLGVVERGVGGVICVGVYSCEVQVSMYSLLSENIKTYLWRKDVVCSIRHVLIVHFI